MLTIMLPETEQHLAAKLTLEHSLVSLSKWEALHEKVFFSREEKTIGETYSYVRQMLLVEEPPDFEGRLTNENLLAIQTYINSPQSATTFRQIPGERPSNEIITNELMYFWLVQFNIPFDPTETWHLNRLMTLVKICGIKQAKPKKMSKADQVAEMRRINEERRRQLGSSG